MRSFFCFIRLRDDYSLQSCSVNSDRFNEPEHLSELAFAEFARQGIRLKAAEIFRMHFVADPRNEEPEEADERVRHAVAAHPDIPEDVPETRPVGGM